MEDQKSYNQMLKYYFSKKYRRIYKQLNSIDIFSSSILIDLQQYNHYIQRQVIQNSNFHLHLQIFNKQQLTSFKIIKILLFMHCWLQNTCILEEQADCLRLMKVLIDNAEINVLRVKQARRLGQMKIAKYNKIKDIKANIYLNQQIQLTKEIFLIQNIIKPYILYLQKIISNFQFYNLLKKSLMKMLCKQQIWVLFNLFTNLNAVVINTPILCKFLKISFAPLAIAISNTLSKDITKFYTKINKYMTFLCDKIERRYQNYQRKQNKIVKQQLNCSIYQENIQEIINLKQYIKQLNKKIQILYSDPVINQNLQVNQPVFIDTDNQQICFVIQLMKGVKKQSNSSTPKFSQHKLQIGISKEESLFVKHQQRNHSIFSDITNTQDLCTFRIDKEDNKFKINGNQFKKHLRWTTQN